MKRGELHLEQALTVGASIYRISALTYACASSPSRSAFCFKSSFFCVLVRATSRPETAFEFIMPKLYSKGKGR